MDLDITRSMRVPKRGMSGSLPKKGYFIATLLVGALATLVLAAIALPLILHRSSLEQDAAAKDLLLDVGSRMASCARGAGEGSYAGCRASEMEKVEPGINWRDGVAPHGWGEGRLGRVYVSELGEASYQLETTSGSGRVFSYARNGDGAITRKAGGGGYESDW